MSRFADAFPYAPQSVSSFLGWGAFPLKVEVSLTPSDEVQQLRTRVDELSAAVQELKVQFDRTEYLYRCETIINLRLQDFCREHGLKVPRHLLSRPYDLTG